MVSQIDKLKLKTLINYWRSFDANFIVAFTSSLLPNGTMQGVDVKRLNMREYSADTDNYH